MPSQQYCVNWYCLLSCPGYVYHCATSRSLGYLLGIQYLLVTVLYHHHLVSLWDGTYYIFVSHTSFSCNSSTKICIGMGVCSLLFPLFFIVCHPYSPLHLKKYLFHLHICLHNHLGQAPRKSARYNIGSKMCDTCIWT